MKSCSEILEKISQNLFWSMKFKNNSEFEQKYLQISIQRGKVFNFVILVVILLSFSLDFALAKDHSINPVYHQTLFKIHVVILFLSIVYILIYRVLEKRSNTKLAKAVIISDLFLTIFIAGLISLNSQRYTGNTDAYILAVLSAALIVPLYPKWVFGIYSLNHGLFLVGLSYFSRNSATMLKQVNTSSIVFIAFILFIVMYGNNVKNFLTAEILKEDKQTFLKLFETNPFPLVISRVADGKVQYLNHKAMAFYEIQPEQLPDLYYQDFFENIADFKVILKMLEANEKVTDYAVKQKSSADELKSTIINFELIDYFGEKSVLSGIADITEIKRIEHELKIHAFTDALTGVANRRYGMELMEKKLDTAKLKKEEFNLCFLDIDNLKFVNDQFGHLEGDSLIIEVCKIIREEISPEDIIFRYGGDEFIILFKDNSRETIDKTCRGILSRFEILNRIRHKSYSISASLGLFSQKPDMNFTPEQIIEAVDQEMYRNKLLKKESG